MRPLRPTDRSSVLGQVLLGVVTVSLLLSGCAGAPRGDAQVVGDAEVVEGYDCLAPNLGGWAVPPDPINTADPQHPDAPDAGRVPAGFTPAKAVRCDQMASINDAEGQWSGVTAITLTGDLTPLLAALAEPDDGTGFGPCTADMELVSPLWLVDATGKAINVHYPRNRCAKTKPGVHNALAGLSILETTTLKRTLVVPRAALDSGCAAAWAVPFDERTLLSIPSAGSFSGTDGMAPVPSKGIADNVLTELDGMRWCRYAVEPSAAGASGSKGAAAVPGTITRHSGRFVAGGTLDSATAQLVANVAASEPMPRSCDESSTEFLALWPSRQGLDLGTVITVELDGCKLLYRDGSGMRALPSDVLEILTSQTSI